MTSVVLQHTPRKVGRRRTAATSRATELTTDITMLAPEFLPPSPLGEPAVRVEVRALRGGPVARVAVTMRHRDGSTTGRIARAYDEGVADGFSDAGSEASFDDCFTQEQYSRCAPSIARWEGVACHTRDVLRLDRSHSRAQQ